MRSSKEKILIGLSGGVDSAVAAYLLKRQGHCVHAVFMKNFSEQVGQAYVCPWKEDRLSAYRVAAHLGIPIETWNFEREYRAKVLQYLFTEYRSGRTPNPDVVCNAEIKFTVFLDRARREGYDCVATGHYAGVRRDAGGMVHLLKAKDRDKDQSYFLAGLSQSQLRHVRFPLETHTKPQVRAIAKRIKLPNASRPDSQGICFVGNVDMETFLRKKIKPKIGKVVTTDGTVIGEHRGVWYYTIGQRKGIRIGGGPALYVIAKDSARNRLIVGTDDQLQLFKKEIMLSDWHWIGKEYVLPFRCKAKIRYRQEDQTVILEKVPVRSLRARRGRSAGVSIVARFTRPQRAVSPGQFLVAYKARELIGSGVIV